MATSKLYAPLISARLPAFYQDDDDNLIFYVPYEENRAVSPLDYSTIIMRLKTVQNDVVCFSSSNFIRSAENPNVLIYTIGKEVYQESEQIWRVNLGQFYQLQLAYVNTQTNQIGYYSSVGMTKFSSMPDVGIENMSSISINDNLYTYKGTYSQYDGKYYWDTTEKVYQYRFIISRDSEVTDIIKDSGWLLHDSSTDENYYSSFDSYTF